MEHDRVNLVGTNRIKREAVLFEPKVRPQVIKISNIGRPTIWFEVKHFIVTEAYNLLMSVIRGQ